MASVAAEGFNDRKLREAVRDRIQFGLLDVVDNSVVIRCDSCVLRLHVHEAGMARDLLRLTVKNYLASVNRRQFEFLFRLLCLSLKKGWVISTSPFVDLCLKKQLFLM